MDKDLINSDPIISVIIPCFNSGEYLLDAIKSVETYPDKNIYEIIIINDGSTDSLTLKLLGNIQKINYTVLHHENKGPAAARNTGVKYARGKYILFLDSDNRIKSTYISKGIEILDKFEDVGVVYGNPIFFGEETGVYFFPKEYDLKQLTHSNYIDTCTVIRKSVWEQVGGFDESRILTQEDWDFWIRVGKLNWKFYYINEILFEYRRRKNSHVINSLEEQRFKELLKYIYTKHIDIFVDNYLTMNYELERLKKERQTPFRTMVKLILKKLNYNVHF